MKRVINLRLKIRNDYSKETSVISRGKKGVAICLDIRSKESKGIEKLGLLLLLLLIPSKYNI